jgi:hypothetical protein
LFMTPLLDFRDNPPLRADATLGRQFGTKVLYSLGDPTKPYLGYPLDTALQLGLDANNGIKGARVALRAVSPDLDTSYVHNWFLGVQRDIGRGLVIEANYIGSAGRRLYNAANVNRFRGDLLDNLFQGLNPSFSSINFIESTSSSIFHGGTIQVRKPFSRGFMLQSAYTFGKAIDDADDLVGITNYQDISNRRLNIAGVWDLPFLSRGNGLAGKLLGGWKLAGTAILQTGNPMTVTTGAPWPLGDYNADGVNGDRPNPPASGVKQSGWERSEFQSGIFRASDFPLPQPGTNGFLGRNTFRGPGYAQVDLSLSKAFPITEKITSHLRVDAFNALNRVNLNNPTLDLSNNNFGRSTSSFTPRILQLGLRVTF